MKEEKEMVGAWIGVDWASEKHECVLHDCESGKNKRFKVANTAEALHAWLEELELQYPAQKIGVAMEGSRNLLLHVLCAHKRVLVYSIHPEAAANYRKAFSPSGAKDDPRDAAALLDMVLTKRDKLEPLHLMDEASRLLDGLCRERRSTVDERTKLVQKLNSKLNMYYPQARAIVGGDLTATMACDFIIKYGDLGSAKRAKAATLTKFFHTHNSRSRALIEKRISLVAEAVPATLDSAVIDPLKLSAIRLAQQINSLNVSIRAFDAAIATAFRDHADHEIFESLPGAGAVLAPRLAAAMGSDRSRYKDAAEMQCKSGIAPLTESSGKRIWVHRRWRCPKFLLQSFHEYADQSMKWSPWAKAYYNLCRARNRDANHHAIIRSLAFKWIRIIYACWKAGTAYSEELYQAQLLTKGSPVADYLPQVASCQ